MDETWKLLPTWSLMRFAHLRPWLSAMIRIFLPIFFWFVDTARETESLRELRSVVGNSDDSVFRADTQCSRIADDKSDKKDHTEQPVVVGLRYPHNFNYLLIDIDGRISSSEDVLLGDRSPAATMAVLSQASIPGLYGLCSSYSGSAGDMPELLYCAVSGLHCSFLPSWRG